MVKAYIRLLVFFLFIFNVAESQETSYPISFSSTSGGLTENNGVWTAGTSGLWAHTGLSLQTFDGNARIMMKYEAANAVHGIIGVDNSDSLPQSPFYSDINAGIVLYPGGVVKKVENNGGVSVGTVVIGDWVCLYRSGSVFKVQKSSDNRATWTDMGTLTFTSSASLHITSAVFQNGKIYSPTVAYYPSVPVIFSSTSGGLTESNGIWTASATGLWAHAGLSSQTFTGNARIMMKYENANAVHGIIGVDTSNSLPQSPFYSDINAGIVIYPGGVVKKVENNAGISVGTIAIGDWVCLYRAGSSFKVQKSIDNRSTWIDIGTLAYTSSASLHITAAVFQSGKIYNPTLESTNLNNDAACSAVTLIAGGAQRCGNNTNATSVNDPASVCGVPANSLWYQYTATSTGTVKLAVTTPAAPANPLHGTVSWYTRSGTCPAVSFSGTGNCQEFGDGGNNDVDFLVSPVLTAGTTYYIMIDGYAGDVGEFCLSIPFCSPALAVQIDNIISNGARVSWTGTGTYILEYGPAGFIPGTGNVAGTGSAIISSAVPVQTITGLSPLTTYEVYIRQNCSASSNGYSDNTAVATFTTLGQPPVNDDCSNAINVTVFDDGCAGATQGTTFNATASLTTPLPDCGVGEAGYDDDVWFKFTPLPGQLFVTIDFVSTGGNNNFVAQIYTSSDNTCSGTFALFACSEDSGPDNLYRFTSMPVTAGTTYFVRVFSYSKGVNSQFTICVTKAALINDNAATAVLVNVDAGCNGAAYSNVGATQSVGEPTGSCSSTTGYATAWYKFKAPAGGAVRISTAAGSGNTLTNTRVALFNAIDVNDYNTFTIIGCDEDGGAGSFGSMSVLYATGLTAGFTYYIQVDKFDNTVAEGTYCITIDKLKDNMLSAANNCSSVYQTPAGSIPSYKGWVSLMDANSKLIALVRDTLGGRVDAYTVSQNINAGAVRKDNTSGEYYLNRSYTINNTAATNTAVNLQFFFLASEQAALAAVDHAADALANLRVTRQSAITCQPDFVTANGTNSELQQTGSGISNGVGWITVNTTGFSNFYIHSVKSYLTAKVFLQGAYNASLGRHKDVTSAWANVLNTYAKNQPYNPVKYEGFGANTSGGKGQQVVHVTNLNATGPGSLHDAIGSNRTIVFDVGGTINDFSWDSSIESSVSFLTIDGSTAPAPGITLNNNYSITRVNGLSFQYGCHDIIVKNIRVRNAINDGINVVGGYNMVFDHVSVAECGDGNLDITDGAHDITVQYSVFGHSGNGAMLIAYPGTRDISLHHNLFNSTGAGVGERNPLVHNAINFVPNIISYLMADYTNNIVWNWGNTNGGGYGSGVDYGGTLQVRNNFYQSITLPGSAIVVNKESIGAKLYASGNISGNAGINPNSVSNMDAPWSVAAVTTQDACTAAAIVIAKAGCQPRDAIDQVLINAVSLAGCPAAASADANYTGAESVANDFFKSSAATTDIVDWVLLEIKEPSGTTITRRAAFVREDGMIVDLDGVSPVSLYNLTSGNYNLTIRHRNHLAVRTSTLQSFSGSGLGVSSFLSSYDYTTAQSQAYQNPSITTNAAMAETNGVFMLWAGNANLDEYVRVISQILPPISSDAAYILAVLGGNPNVTVEGYSLADINMDGKVRIISQILPPISSDAASILGISLNGNPNGIRREHK